MSVKIAIFFYKFRFTFWTDVNGLSFFRNGNNRPNHTHTNRFSSISSHVILVQISFDGSVHTFDSIDILLNSLSNSIVLLSLNHCFAKRFKHWDFFIKSYRKKKFFFMSQELSENLWLWKKTYQYVRMISNF